MDQAPVFEFQVHLRLDNFFNHAYTAIYSIFVLYSTDVGESHH
jgi:hypothetical protein